MRLSLLPALFVSAYVSALAGVARAADMSFSTLPYTSDGVCAADCPRIMQASGPITAKTPQEFLDFARREINRPGLINVLLIHSPGGSVNSSIAFGRILRKLNTVIVVARAMDSSEIQPPKPGRRNRDQASNLRFLSGTCASACVYALAGGIKRVVPPESRVAVHRMAGNIGQFDPATLSFERRQVYAGEAELNALTSYIHEMGVSTELVELAESIPHENAHILSTREMRRLNLAGTKM